MAANGRILISHARSDAIPCRPLSSMLEAWAPMRWLMGATPPSARLLYRAVSA